MLVLKPSDLSSIPWTHTVEGENGILRTALCLLYACCFMVVAHCKAVHAPQNKYIKCNFKMWRNLQLDIDIIDTIWAWSDFSPTLFSILCVYACMCVRVWMDKALLGGAGWHVRGSFLAAVCSEVIGWTRSLFLSPGREQHLGEGGEFPYLGDGGWGG